VQATLEDVLREKEGELKLYQRFLDLRSFCQERIFRSTDVPLQRHINAIKDFTEQLIPEPRARTEEMFSGEIFVMLCLLYLHDAGVTPSYDWYGNDEIFEQIDKSTKTLIINRDIAKRLDIPESAIEIVNSLIFYTTVKRIPTEWEIKEDSRRAIIRNTRALEHVFSFAHLMWDIFSPDATVLSLRRSYHPNLRIQCGVSSVTADSREGLLFIRCLPEIPYQAHLLEMVKGYVESAFKKFKEALNGKLGFQYKSIVWETGDTSTERLGVTQRSETPPFCPVRIIPDRWEEAAAVLDTLFKNGHVIVTGLAGCGKTTLMESFLLPQLSKISTNVFRSEVWEKPVGELREAVALVTDDKPGSSDMVSVCNKLRQTGPCFFILDCCERLQFVEEGEKEKLKRFVDFCLGSESLYLIILGDKEDFFDWYQPFSRINLSAIHEVKLLEGVNSLPWASEPASGESLKETIDDLLKKAPDKRDLREVIAALVGGAPHAIARRALADIRGETGLPLIRIVDYLTELKGKGIVKEQRSFDATYYTIASRHLIEPLREYLKLSEFDEKRRIRNEIVRARKEGAWLSPEMLDAVDRWIGKLVFEGEEMAFVLAGAIHCGRAPDALFVKFEKDMRPGFNIRSDAIVGLLKERDVEKRKAAVRLLSRIRDDQMVNELLLHLKREEDHAVKTLILETLVDTGKKKTLVALMRTLSDMDDRQWKFHAIELLARGDALIARDALLILAEAEKDTQILDAIDRAFSKLEESL
jgi:hypothetical protein